MLKLIWEPAAGAAAAPDQPAYLQALDRLTALFDTDSATATFSRGTPVQVDGLDEVARVINAWLARRAVPVAAVKLMLHGYAFDPRHPNDPTCDPFVGVYGYPGDNGPDPRLSWLPLVEECDDRGMRHQETAIAFAWVSTGSVAEYAHAGWSDSYQFACVDLAPLAAQALAAVLLILGAANVRVDVLAHSLGTRLFTKAAAALGNEVTMLNNVILLDGAEYSVDAAETFVGRQFNVVNVTNEVDAVLATGAEQLGDPSRGAGMIVSCSLGRYGLGSRASWDGRLTFPPNWVDIALDRLDVRRWFSANGGYSLTPTASDNVHPQGNFNHWACYTEPGNRRWVTDLLWKPGFNGGAFAQAADFPQGSLGNDQIVFAGVPIPNTTPMTAMARLRYQQGVA